jgi:hypothetical protein
MSLRIANGSLDLPMKGYRFESTHVKTSRTCVRKLVGPFAQSAECGAQRLSRPSSVLPDSEHAKRTKMGRSRSSLTTYLGSIRRDDLSMWRREAVNVRDVRLTVVVPLTDFPAPSRMSLVSSPHDRGESGRIEGRSPARLDERSSLYV